MGTKTGELRETLLGAIDDLRSGRLKAVDAKAIAALAAQVNASLAAELAVRASGVDEKIMGDLKLGHEVTPQPMTFDIELLPPGIIGVRQHRIADDEDAA